MEREKYAFIGDFQCVSGVVDIIDPHIHPLSVLQEKIPLANEKMLCLRSMLMGLYQCYHKIDSSTGDAQQLILIHESYDVKDLNKNNKVMIGYVSSSVGGAVAAVDKRYKFDTSYCYSIVDPDAIYDGIQILSEFKNSKFESDIRKLVDEKSSKDINPTGADILEIVPAEYMQRICLDGNTTTIWSKMLEKRLFNFREDDKVIQFRRHKNAITIKGGVASMADSGLLKCGIYRNHLGDVFAVSINLDAATDIDIMDPFKYDENVEIQ